MSFAFDGSNDQLTGTLTSQYDQPITMGIYISRPSDPATIQNFFEIGATAAGQSTSLKIISNNASAEWVAAAANSAAVFANALVSATSVTANTWIPLVATFVNASSRFLYVGSVGNVGAENTLSRDMGGLLKYISLGENLLDLQDFNGKLAEAAIWNKTLNATEIGQYMSGLAAPRIGSANLIFYNPLSSAGLSNLGSDAGGTLTATGNAAFDADHPIIDQGLSGYKAQRQMLMDVG